jgi:sugar-specific transcriptional regulator TrmB
MNTELLVNLGLTLPQAAIYLALVEHGTATVTQVAQLSGQTRTNTYALLDKLTELGLAERIGGSKKLNYRALSPDALEHLITQQRQAAEKREQLMRSNLPDLMTFFHTNSERPGIRFFQGKDEIMKIYDDQIATGKDILVIRSPDDIRFFKFEEMLEIRHRAHKYGIHRHKIEPDFPHEPGQRNTMSRSQVLLTTTYVAEGGYTAPVEWDIYGDKVSIISFGKEAIGMIIESRQIAESLRQIYGLLDAGLHRQPDYDKLPTHRSIMHPDDLK